MPQPVKDGILQSCMFIAPDSNQLPDKSWLEQLFVQPELDKIERACVLAGKPATGMKNCGPTVCSCFSVGRNTIIDAIVDGGLQTVEEIGETLQAGTNCGSCVPELKTLLNLGKNQVVNG